MGQGEKSSSHTRSACTECQRRKQKCNREWPCDHCQKRKVADKCRFGATHPSPPKAPTPESSKKRQLSRQNSAESLGADSWDDDEPDFDALGYTPPHLVENKPERKSPSDSRASKQYFMDAPSCPQLNRALKLLPPRPYTDALVQNFLNSVNYHNYILYAPSFMEEYRSWWSRRSENRSLGLQWTCLLLIVCACSAQYANQELRRKLESDLGQPTQKLSEQFHGAARELHSVIPVRSNHLLNVQFLLHSCYWYRSEARFVEAWHVLSTAVREAQELGIAREKASGSMSEFDREMRRRVWCIIDTWDWQLSTLLSRQMIIDRTDCDVGYPSLTLEGYSPSPLLHTKLQSEIIRLLFKRFGLPKNVVDLAEIKVYQAMVKHWMDEFPKCFDMNNPDKSQDSARPWITPHRHQLRTFAYSIALDPVRSCLARPLLPDCAPEEAQVRRDSINFALNLMASLHAFFDCLYPHDSKFHLVLFSVFDTAAVLCSAVLHDQHGVMSRRAEVIGAIEKALAMLKRLHNLTKTARSSYEVLAKVAQPILQPAFQTSSAGMKSPAGPKPMRAKFPASALTPPNTNQADMAASRGSPYQELPPVSYTTPPSDPGFHCGMPHSSGSFTAPGGPAMYYAPPVTTGPASAALAHEAPVVGMPPGIPLQNMGGISSGAFVSMTPPTDEYYASLGFNAFTPQDLDVLAPMWDYESLNLNFGNAPNR